METVKASHRGEITLYRETVEIAYVLSKDQVCSD